MKFYQPSQQIGCCDMWSIEKDGVWYTYHSQVPFPDCKMGDNSPYGVSTSPDLLDFERQQDIFNPKGEWFNRCAYAGDVMWWKDKYYMIFSGCHHGEEPGDSIDVMGIATSDDLLHWEEYAGNPVLTDPDERWYEGKTVARGTRMVNLRDPHFIRDLCDDTWVYLCFAGGTNDPDNYRSGCIGLCRSQDMIHWEFLPPLFAPKQYTLMEVPRVFKVGGKYMLTWETAPWYGTRFDTDIANRAQDDWEVMLHYAVADKPEGPYTMPEDPTVFRGYYCPYVIHPVTINGQVEMISTMFTWHPSEGNRFVGGVMPAMPLRYDGELVATFPERWMSHYPKCVPFDHTLPQLPYAMCENHDGVIDLQGAACCLLPVTEKLKNVVLDVDIDISVGRAGVALQYDEEKKRGYGVLYNCARNEIEFVQIGSRFRLVTLATKERHPAKAKNPNHVHLQVIADEDRTLVFVDGVMRGTYSFPPKDAGRFGVLTECGQGQVKLNPWFTE